MEETEGKYGQGRLASLLALADRGVHDGASVLLIGEYCAAAESLVGQTIAHALLLGRRVVVTLTQHSIEELEFSLEMEGVKMDSAMESGNLSVLDWYSHRSHNIVGIEDEGAILRLGPDIFNIATAVEMALEVSPGRRPVVILDVLEDALEKDSEKNVRSMMDALAALIRDKDGVVVWNTLESSRGAPDSLAKSVEILITVMAKEEGATLHVLHDRRRALEGSYELSQIGPELYMGPREEGGGLPGGEAIFARAIGEDADLAPDLVMAGDEPLDVEEVHQAESPDRAEAGADKPSPPDGSGFTDEALDEALEAAARKAGDGFELETPVGDGGILKESWSLDEPEGGKAGLDISDKLLARAEEDRGGPEGDAQPRPEEAKTSVPPPSEEMAEDDAIPQGGEEDGAVEELLTLVEGDEAFDDLLSEAADASRERDAADADGSRDGAEARKSAEPAQRQSDGFWYKDEGELTVCPDCGAFITDGTDICGVCGAVARERAADGKEEKAGTGLFICPQCGAFVAESSGACQVCGVSFEEEEEEAGEALYGTVAGEAVKAAAAEGKIPAEEGGLLVCSGCGAFLKPEMTNCPICDAPVDAAVLGMLQLEKPEAEGEADGFWYRDEGELHFCKACGAFLQPEDERCPICDVPARRDAGSAPAEHDKADGFWYKDGQDRLRACPRCGAFTSSEETVCGVCQTPLDAAPEEALGTDEGGGMDLAVCPHCGAFRPEGELCPVCQAEDAEKARCAHCGAELGPDDMLCSICQEPVARESGDGEPFELLPDDRGRLDLVSEPEGRRREPAEARGLTNGTGRGLVNGTGRGLSDGVGRTNGLTNGTKRGLTNGVGRTNGLTNGVGRTNGLTNGVGRTNGLTNGMGRTNGLPRSQNAFLKYGIPRSGLVNGTGRLMGMVNGTRLDREWGLTNGTGITNGLRATRYQPKFASTGMWTKAVAALVVVLVLVVGVPFLLGTLYTEQGIRSTIDGKFSEWDILAVPDPSGDFGGTSGDLASFAVREDEGILLAFASFHDSPFSSQGARPVRLDVIFDIDGSASTGMPFNGLGGDAVASLSVVNGSISASYRELGADGSRGENIPGLAIAHDGSRMELSVPSEDGMASASFVSVDAFGNLDEGEAPLLFATSMPAPRFDWTASPVVSPGSELATLSLAEPAEVEGFTLEFVNYPVSSGLEVHWGGTVGVTAGHVSPSGIQRVVEVVLDEAQEWRNVTFWLEGDVSSFAGYSLGFSVSSIESGGMALSCSRPTLGSSYIASAPAGVAIDGAFADWDETVVAHDPAGDGTGVDAPDIVRWGASSSGILALMAEGSPALFRGLPGPLPRSYISYDPGDYVADSDLDDIPDESDSMPFDFDNDGRPDAESFILVHGVQCFDLDGDSVPDYPSGIADPQDYWLENGATGARVYIGPLSTAEPEEWQDAVFFHLDLDGDPATGRRISSNFGEEALVGIWGVGGRPVNSSVYLPRSFGGRTEWVWASPVLTGWNSTAVEAGVAWTVLGGSWPSMRVLVEARSALGGRDLGEGAVAPDLEESQTTRSDGARPVELTGFAWLSGGEPASSVVAGASVSASGSLLASESTAESIRVSVVLADEGGAVARLDSVATRAVGTDEFSFVTEEVVLRDPGVIFATVLVEGGPDPDSTPPSEVRAPGVTVTPDNTANGLAGSTVTYAHTITNTATRPDNKDEYNVLVSSSQGWQVDVYFGGVLVATNADGTGGYEFCNPAYDTNGDNIPDTTQINRGGTYAITIVVTIPAGATTGTTDVTTVTAQSIVNAGVQASATDTTMVPEYGLMAGMLATLCVVMIAVSFGKSGRRRY